MLYHIFNRNSFQPTVWCLNWYHSEMSFFEHQTAGTRRRRANMNRQLFWKESSVYVYHLSFIPKCFIIFHLKTGARHSIPTDSFIGFTCRYSRFLFQWCRNALRIWAFRSLPGSVSISLREIETEPTTVISIIPIGKSFSFRRESILNCSR